MLNTIRKRVRNRLRGHVKTYHTMIGLGIPKRDAACLSFGPHTWNARTVELNEGALNKLREKAHV